MNRFFDTAQKLQNENISQYITLFTNLSTKELAEIVIVGEFSNGKSTLVNALMGLDILPSGIGSVTNNITTIQKGEINQLSCSTFSEKNIDVNEIKKTIQKLASNNEAYPIRIELTNFPFKDYVIVDTPGINDQNRERELITYEYAPKCDAMIFVLDIARGFTRYEIDFFTDLSETAKDKVFIVLNKSDAYDHVEMSKAHEMLKHQGISKEKAFIVSSKKALAAIQEKNHEMLKASGIMDLRQELFQYVDNSQSRTVLRNRKQTILKRINDLCICEIDSNIASLKMNYDEIEIIIRNLELEVLDARQEADKILSALNEKIVHLENSINQILHSLKKELSDELFYKTPDEIRQFVQSGKYASIVSTHLKEINAFLESDISLVNIDLKTNFLMSFFDKLPFLKEWINSPILDDIETILLSVATISPTVKTAFELIKKYSKRALEHVTNKSAEFSDLKEKIDAGIVNIENAVKYEIDKYVNDQKISISYKSEELNAKILGTKKAREEKNNQKENLDGLIKQHELLKASLLSGYEIELSNLNTLEA